MLTTYLTSCVKIFCRSKCNPILARNFHKTPNVRNQIEENTEQPKKEQKIHIPVLLKESIQNLVVKSDGVFLDCTFGEGGHTTEILEQFPNATVWALDRDAEVAENAKKLEEKYKGRFFFRNSRFGNLLNPQKLFPASLLKTGFDGILMDIGVSSRQLESPHRGFSFRDTHSGPLDMRMDGPANDSITQESAADIVNNASEFRLRQILLQFGQEKHASRIAKAIVNYRNRVGDISTTMLLANIVREAVGFREAKLSKIDPATLTFQALRIFVNDELEELQKALIASERLLAPQGRLVVISFHSLEDRMVKRFMVQCSKYKPEDTRKNSFALVSKKIIEASKEEELSNPRSRSAKMRVATRLDSPPLVKEGARMQLDKEEDDDDDV